MTTSQNKEKTLFSIFDAKEVSSVDKLIYWIGLLSVSGFLGKWILGPFLIGLIETIIK